MGKKYLLGLLFVLFIAVLINSCKQATESVEENNTNTGSGNVTLKGQVVDSTSNVPLASAVVKVTNGTEDLQTLSDSAGYYKISFPIVAATQIKMTVSKEGYSTVTSSVQVTAGSLIEVGMFKLHVQNFAILKGLVIDGKSGNALSSAVVRVQNSSGEVQTITDDKGLYSATVPMDKNKQITLIAVKEGYYADTASVFATVGRTIDVPMFKLSLRNSVNITSGNPASIVLVGQTAQSIGVKESGSVESTTLIWEVQDSAGTPIDVTHSALLEFSMGVGPGGGEYMSPAEIKTNALGRASLNISSGTKAGVMQLIAQIKTPGKIIRSKPVSIAIHGGLPDQTHFDLAPDKLNIAGYNVDGVLDGISAYVGDKYANPVRKLTAVYFTTDGAYIEGSALTNDLGVATARLISANPRPFHPVLGKGFATITATTADENYNVVKGQAIVLFSGLPFLSLAEDSPKIIDVPPVSTQSFHYYLKDQNGNPLTSGTSIQISIEGDSCKVSGDVNVSLPDTQSKGWTEFWFTVVNKGWSVRPVTVDIKSTGPNGSAKMSLSGTLR